MAKHILFIIGSFRKQSFNRQLAEEAMRVVDGRADVSILDFSDVPFFNQDIESSVPPAVERVRNAVKSADGIWIFTPEYNGAVPGTLKNLLDWLSRPLVPGDFSSGTAAAGKKVTVSGAGGKNATRSVRASLKTLLEFMRMETVGGEGVGFAVGAEAFKSDRLSLSDEEREALKTQAEAFLSAL